MAAAWRFFRGGVLTGGLSVRGESPKVGSLSSSGGGALRLRAFLDADFRRGVGVGVRGF